jgi:4-hydroxy-3-methylbut-2-enyl diphosphate reductase
VIGTMGQVPDGAITLVETVEDVARLEFPDELPLSFLTQTTLSVDDTAEIVTALRTRFPRIVGPRAEDICYATSNRQAAVKAIADACDLILVIGAPNVPIRCAWPKWPSGGYTRLPDPARGGNRSGLAGGRDHAGPYRRRQPPGNPGARSGGPARPWRTVTEETVKVRDEENMVFKLPRQLAA